MKMDDFRDIQAVGNQIGLSGPLVLKEALHQPTGEASDNEADHEMMPPPTAQTIWPRVWPGL